MHHFLCTLRFFSSSLFFSNLTVICQMKFAFYLSFLRFANELLNNLTSAFMQILVVFFFLSHFLSPVALSLQFTYMWGVSIFLHKSLSPCSSFFNVFPLCFSIWKMSIDLLSPILSPVSLNRLWKVSSKFFYIRHCIF